MYIFFRTHTHTHIHIRTRDAAPRLVTFRPSRLVLLSTSDASSERDDHGAAELGGSEDPRGASGGLPREARRSDGTTSVYQINVYQILDPRCASM